jgi:hypothetical protein
LLLPVLIGASAMYGIAIATEVASIGIAYAILGGLVVYRSFDWKQIYPALVGTASLAARFLANAPGGAYGFLAGSVVLFIILGSVLEGIPAMVLFGPLLFPVAKQLGVREVHYAMVAILAMGIGPVLSAVQSRPPLGPSQGHPMPTGGRSRFIASQHPFCVLNSSLGARNRPENLEVGWSLQHAIIAAAARMVLVNRAAQRFAPEAGCLVHIGGLAIDQHGAQTGTVHFSASHASS